MKRKKSKWLGFFLGMVIYALIVLIAASFALKLLWDYADNYERSLPNRRMAAYVSTLDETHVKKISLDFVSSLDRSIQSESDAYAVIWRCFVGGVQYELVSTDSEGRTIRSFEPVSVPLILDPPDFNYVKSNAGSPLRKAMLRQGRRLGNSSRKTMIFRF